MLPHEIKRLILSFCHNPKARLHKELRNRTYAWIRARFLGRARFMRAFPIGAPFAQLPVFNHPLRNLWPIVYAWER